MASSSLPTDAELELLAVLWDKGRATVREVLDAVNRKRQVGYTTVLKLLQIMTDKGLVSRDESSRTHVYEPADPPKPIDRHFCTHCFLLLKRCLLVQEAVKLSDREFCAICLEVANPKSEERNPKQCPMFQIQMTKTVGCWVYVWGIGAFVF